MRARIALFALLILPGLTLVAQTIPSPLDEEAPETLFDFVVSDAEVSLFTAGSWTTGFAPGLGWVFARGPEGELTATGGYTFPGIEPVAFFNDVNLTLSLWLVGRYFFETTVSEEIENSTILFGYAGRENESVQSVIIGNAGIGMGSYPYLGFGDESGSIGQDAPGMSAAFISPVSTHELMVRFAPAEEQEIRFANGGIVSESRIDAYEYEVNRHFVLPDGNLDFLDVYVESAGGTFEASDGTRYRAIDLARETTFSLTDGTVSFDEAPQTRVLVYYEVGSVAIGHTSLGRASYFGLDAAGRPDSDDVRDFDYVDLRSDPSSDSDYYDALFGADFSLDDQEFDVDSLIVDLDGQEAFVLHQPGRYSPFASAAYYPLVDRTATSITIDYPGAAGNGSALRVTPLPANELVRVSAGATDPRAFGNRYPFAAAANAVAGIYGPEAAPQPSDAELVFRSVTPADRIVLPAGFIPGSVRITRNGVAERRFAVTDEGEIVFDRALTATDVIRVAFRSSSSAESGDLLFGSGNIFTLGSGTLAELALGARWKPLGQQFSTQPGEHPGRLTLSGSISTDSNEWKAPPRHALEAGIRTAVTLASPDTSGVFRASGMNETARSIPMAVTGMFAAPPPIANPDAGISATTLTPASRGRLRYADYYETGILGARELLPYSVDIAPEPYASDGRAGPYPARSVDAAYTGTVAVLDYEIEDPENWAAGVVRVNGGKGTDFSDIRSFVIPYRVLESVGAVRVFVQIGAIGEDLDVDGMLDTGSGGLPFRDAAAGLTLPTGTIPPPGVSYTEDANGNGVLDAELSDRVLSREITDIALPAVGTAAPWRTAEISLTSAEARRLSETRAIRFLVYSDSGDAAGKIAFGSIAANGSSFAVSVPMDGMSDPEVSVSERLESDYSGDALASVFPNVASRFVADDSAPRLLSVQWTSLGSETITLARAAEVPASDYGQLRLYHRQPVSVTEDVTLTLRALSGATVIAESTTIVTSSRWEELVVELPADRDEIITRLEIDISGPDAAEVLLDELSFWEPRTSIGTIVSGTLRWQPDFELLAGATSLLSDVIVEQTITAQTASFPDDIGLSRSGVQSSSDIEATIVGAGTSFGVDLLSNQLGSGVQLRHRFSLPLLPGLVLVDEYRVGYRQLEPGSTHALAAAIALGRSATAAIDWASDQRDSGSVEWAVDVGFDREPDAETGSAVSGNINVALSEDREPSPVSGAYPSAWIYSFADLAPRAFPLRRAGSAGAGTAVDLGRIGLELDTTANFDSDQAAERTSVFASLSLASPVQISDGLELTTGLSREIELTATGQPASTPAEDVARASSLLVEYPLFFEFFPVVDLASPRYITESASLTEGLLAATYRPTVSAELRRRITSSPWSLLIPTALRVSLARPAQRIDDAASTSYEASLDAAFIAPNLFGRLGTSPLFDFYDTDEYQSSVSITTGGGDEAAWDTEIDLDQRVRILWTSRGSLVLENTLSTGLAPESETRLATGLAWKRPGDRNESGRLPLPPRLAQLDQTLEHISRIEFDYRSQVDTAIFGRLRHESVLRLGEGGSIRAHGAVGVGTERAGDSRSVMLGVQIGIEGRLRL